MNFNISLPQSVVETTAGLTAGFATTLVVHPLDLIKTRLQVDRAPTTHIGRSIRVARDIVRNEGGISAFYRGLTPNLVGNSVSWALYFLWYDKAKKGLLSYHGADSLSYYDYFAASAMAGAATALCTNPIWVIKTRMLSTSTTHTGAYSSILDGSRRIYQNEGLSGFYRGLVPSLFGISHGALQFMAYEQMKKYRYAHLSPGQKDLSNLDVFVASALSKIFAGSLTYPYQLIRARLQIYDADKFYKSATDVVVQVWKQEGITGFYKGLGPNLLRVVPSNCVTFLVYENIRTYLPKAFGGEE